MELFDRLEELLVRTDKARATLAEELAAEGSARRQLEQSAQEMERELARLSAKYEQDAARLNEIVTLERQEKNSFVEQTQQVRAWGRQSRPKTARPARQTHVTAGHRVRATARSCSRTFSGRSRTKSCGAS